MNYSEGYYEAPTMILNDLKLLQDNIQSNGDPLKFLKSLINEMDESNSPKDSIIFNPDKDY